MPVGMQITATGGTPDQRELVTNVMARGLVEHGFSNVALVNTMGEPMVGSHIPSLMDEIRAINPEFMQTPIQIWSVDTVDPLDVPSQEDTAQNPAFRSGLAIATSEVDEGENVLNVMVREPGDYVRPALTSASFEQPVASTQDNTDAFDGGLPKPMENAA